MFVKNGVANVRAIPGFEYIANEKRRDELAIEAARHFECGIKDVAFPTNLIWTGVVHAQLIKNVTDREPDIVKGATIFACSVTKNNGEYSWVNRSARNPKVFAPDSLAAACYMFDEKIDYSLPKDQRPFFDFFYHTTRAIPERFFKPFIAQATKVMAGGEAKCSSDECNNFEYEAKWEAIRELFKKDKKQAESKIQEMLMRNLHIYLSGLSAEQDTEKIEELLVNGILDAANYGLLINIDYKPKGFETGLSAIEKAKAKKVMINSLDKFRYTMLDTALENDRLDEYLAAGSYDQKQLTELITNFISLQPTDEIKLNFIESIQKSKAGKVLADQLSKLREEAGLNKSINDFKRLVMKANLIEAKKSIIKIPKETLFANLSSPMMKHLAELLLEEKADFNKRNDDGNTLLSMVAGLSWSDKLIDVLIKEYHVDPNTLNQDLSAAIKNESFILAGFVLGKMLNVKLTSISLTTTEIKNLFSQTFSQEPNLGFEDHFDDHAIGLLSNFVEPAKLQNILLEIFYESFENSRKNMIENFFRSHALSENTIDIATQEKLMAKLTDYIKSLPDKKTQLEFINTVLSSNSTISNWLFQRAFTPTSYKPKNNLEALKEMKKEIENFLQNEKRAGV